MSTPTQVKRPWRATVRTIFAALVGFFAILPFIVQATGLDPALYPWLAGILAVAAAVTRVMALPQVEDFLAQFLPFLAADPSEGAHRGEGGEAGMRYLAVLALIALVVLLLAVAGVFS